MKKQTKTPDQVLRLQEKERQDAHDLRKSFLIESIDTFTDECEIYDVIRSLGRLRHGLKHEAGEGQENANRVLSDLQSVEALLLDIAKANAKANVLFLASYEQELD